MLSTDNGSIATSMSSLQLPNSKRYWIGLLVVAAFSLWLRTGFPVYALGYAGHESSGIRGQQTERQLRLMHSKAEGNLIDMVLLTSFPETLYIGDEIECMTFPGREQLFNRADTEYKPPLQLSRYVIASLESSWTTGGRFSNPACSNMPSIKSSGGLSRSTTLPATAWRGNQLSKFSRQIMSVSRK